MATKMNGSRVYALGGSQTDFERNWSKEGKGVTALLREVMTDALSNAGLSFGDIAELNAEDRVACFVGNFAAEEYIGQGHLGGLLTEVAPELYGVPSARYEAACASGSVALDEAAARIRLGDYDVAVVVGFELMKTVDSKTGGDYLGYAALREREALGVEFPFPKLFGRLADVYVDKYGLDEDRYMDALARISQINYDNAKRNPLSQTRKWFMDFGQARTRGTQTNPSVGGRLAVSDCSQVTDGAAVVVLAGEGYVKSVGLDAARLPKVLGWGHRNAPMLFDKKVEEAKTSRYALPWTKRAVEDAYNRAGLTSDDIDLFETHDCFTSSEYAAISCFGLTEPGHEWDAVESGFIGFTGKKPINPSGGLIGCGHPVGATGVRMFLDCCKQVTGSAGGYQVLDAKTAMMLNIGGSATTNYSFIVGVGE